ILSQPDLSDHDALRLAFAPFDADAGDTFLLGAVDAGRDLTDADDALVDWIRESAGHRSPIVLECRGDDRASEERDLIRDEHRITVFRTKRSATPEIRTAYWIDAFWCDAFGIRLRGWVHAYEHRVRALRLESAGRSARVDVFSDRA